MSNKVRQTKNHNLQLINTTVIPKYYNCIYSSNENTLIYPNSSYIIIHNLSIDTKKIINNSDNQKIIKIKYLDKDNKFLLVITKNDFHKINTINILSLNSYNINNNQNMYLFSKIIPVEQNFSASNIFIDRFRYNLFLIILSNIEKNILYFFHITNINSNKYDIIPFKKLDNLDLEIIDFKCFYNDSLLICITRNSIVYYKINLEKKLCTYYNSKKFQYKLLPNSLKIDRKNELIAFISSNGESLIYDKEGNNISNIRCPIYKEYFNFILFSDYNNSMCLSTNNGNIFIYKIDYYNDTFVFKVKNYIKYSFINKIIIQKYQYNNINNNDEYKNIISNNNNKKNNNNINIIYFNEKDDLIIFTINNGNNFIYASLSSLINKKYNIGKDTIFIYEFNHTQKMNNGIIIYNANPPSSNNNSYDNIIYSCSNDNILNKRYYNHSSNKFHNYYIDFNYLFKEDNIFITSIRFHPKYGENILYAGDSRGCLYIIYKDRNYQYQKYHLNKDINFFDCSIISIIFSPENDYIIYIGFNNGVQRLYDLSVDKNFNYYKLLTNNFVEKNEIEFRTKKSHALCFCYFFIYNYIFKKCILFLNNLKTIKISKIDSNDLITSNNYSNELLLLQYDGRILDLKIHKSENYIIVLNNQRQILINELHYGNIISKIDLNKIMNYIYNIEIDISGLYLSLICDFKNSPINTNKSSIAILEINSGIIKNYIKETNNPIIKTKFDYYGRYLISFGEKGEIFIWGCDKEIKSNIINALKEIKTDFYYFWDNYKIKNFTDIDMNNYNILNEILESQEKINKEKENNYIDFNSYDSPEDFFRINNHGEKSIEYNYNYNNNISKSINKNNNLNDNSISLIENIDKNNNFTTNISKTISHNLNENQKNTDNTNIFNESNTNENNSENKSIENFNIEDHYINRKSNNYKNSINYIQTFRNYKNNNKYKNKTFRNSFELENEKKNIIENNHIKKRSMSSNNRKISIKNNKSKSLRDIIINKDKDNDILKTIQHKSDINKNGNDNNNNFIETPHFLSPKSINSNYNMNIDDIKNNLNLLSLTLSKQALKSVYSNRENYKDIFDLKKKIVSESSSLLHNERRMMNLANALNKITLKNTTSNNKSNGKEEENDKNISNSNISKSHKSKSSSRKNKYFNYDKRIMLGNNEEEFIKKKYPEPDDIDMYLVNIKNESNTLKNNSNIIKFDNKSDYSNNDNLYFINNNKDKNNSNFNNNYYNKSTSFSMIKEIQNNINTSRTKNNTNLITNNNNFNINEISNIDNTSIGEQISYLENNINKFEKNFGNQ